MKIIFILLFFSLSLRAENCSVQDVSATMDDLLAGGSIKAKIFSPDVKRQLSEYFQRIREEHSMNTENLRNYMTMDLPGGGKYFKIGENLFQQLKNGPPEMRGYLPLGYRESLIDNHGTLTPVLQSPLNMAEIYENAYKSLSQHVGKTISEDDLILPALIFQREGEIKLFRPLLDPFPSKSEGWALVQNAEISSVNFARAIAEGKMPLESQMYFHDLGHIAYDVERPEIMALRRRYYENEARVLGGEQNHLPAHKLGGQYLNEFLITLRLKNRDEIGQLLVPKKIPSQKQRLTELMSDIDSGNFKTRVDEISAKFHDLFEGHGGGWMDGRSMEVFPDSISQTLERRLNMWAFKPEDSMGSYLSQSSYWGLVEQLKLGLKHLEYYQKNPGKQNFGGKILDSSQRYKEVLADIMLDLEKRTAAGLRHNIDVQQVWRDVGTEKFDETPTYKFFREISTKDPSLEQQFLERPPVSAFRN